MDLRPEERRVLGCLVEKQLTTPQQYPLTLNALVLACNQTSSRNPIVDYPEGVVEEAATTLKDRRLLRVVHPSHGRSVTRYRHILDETLALEDRPLALLAVLGLRGPQTAAELRSRTERMCSFAEVADVERELEWLAGRDDPLVVRLPREPGRKELRWTDLLAGAPDPAATDSLAGRHPSPDADHRDSYQAPAPSLWDEVRALRSEVAELRRDLDDVVGRLTS